METHRQTRGDTQTADGKKKSERWGHIEGKTRTDRRHTDRWGTTDKDAWTNGCGHTQG